ncbi:LOW QUALITY PROTEIN: neuroligin-4, Y-linked-like [Anopheles albimanus]|uniref:LOW QUALITY PROTEIN: neuroligin-4, Y-linked-like n=1 Tax=Anopheles albimanus TaxID=7167 RepID=UPI00163F5535|nr:LOW QUALITY PROTEIN: neuroligin-4, Y-linked-like [Anopheles albimanus]
MMLFFLISFAIGAMACGSDQTVDRPIVSTTAGQVQGTTEQCGLFCTFYSFKGIPYAEPPLDALRFSDPVTKASWSGVRDASTHGATCPSQDMAPTESEDCLFLNVYTPSLIGTRPVMVFIHGGAYSGGSGDALYGAEHFMVENVVIVTINYRLGALGFLSTGDRAAAGNWALKDCIEALRWVQRNAPAFGGDPSSVTIFGQSAGGALVHFLTLSPLSSGLFQKAIAHSGSALNSWALQTNPRFYANRLAQALGVPSGDTVAMVTALRSIPYRQIVALQDNIMKIPGSAVLSPIDFGPVVEPSDTPGVVFLPELPIDIMDAGAFQPVPFVTGFTDMDSLMFTGTWSAVNPKLFETFNNNPQLLVPIAWNVARDSARSSVISQAFAQYYWQSESLDFMRLVPFTSYMTDHLYSYGILEAARRHSLRTPVYVYQFAYDGDLNLVKKSFGPLIGIPGAIHADDLCYLFEPKSLVVGEIPPTSHAITVRNRMLRLWTNFAKYGNPTPTVDPLLQNINWSPIAGGTVNVALNIEQNLVPGPNPVASRYHLWQDLAQRYGNNIFRI